MQVRILLHCKLDRVAQVTIKAAIILNDLELSVPHEVNDDVGPTTSILAHSPLD